MVLRLVIAATLCNCIKQLKPTYQQQQKYLSCNTFINNSTTQDDCYASLGYMLVSNENLYCVSTLYSSHCELQPSVIYKWRVQLSLLSCPTETFLHVPPCKVAMPCNDKELTDGKVCLIPQEAVAVVKSRKSPCFLGYLLLLLYPPHLHQESLRAADEVNISQPQPQQCTKRGMQTLQWQEMFSTDSHQVEPYTWISHPSTILIKTDWEFTMIQSVFCWSQ